LERRLHRLSLAAAENAPILPVFLGADGIQRTPEVRCLGLVGDILDHVADLAILDFPDGVPAELEVVPLMVDAEAPHSVEEKAVLGIGDELFQGQFFLAGLEPDIGHPLKGEGRPGIGVGAALGFFLVDEPRQLPCRLVADEYSFFDDVKPPGLYPVVIVAHRA
jgi:hypothetical protein